jgi:uncharacterized membrane protein YphA (DoxX/SURF4 family)
MLSSFPFLMTYGMVGPTIIRIVLGVTLAYFGYQKVIGKGQSSGSNSVTYGGVEILIALFLIIGLFTQVSAFLNAIILIIKIVRKAVNGLLFTDGINYYVLLLAMAISVLFTGAGYLAMDKML